jgi:predicted transcriptional regulator
MNAGDRAMVLSEVMADLRWDMPEPEEVELSVEELAELDRRIERAENGRWYTPEEVRDMIPRWKAKYATQLTR